MAQENREAYIQWLRKEINEYCNSDGNYETFWDYDDRIEPDSVMEAVTRYKEEGYESPSDYLEMRLYDTVGTDTEDYFYAEILLRDLDRAPEEVRECWYESDSIWDDMQEAGYNGIDINLDDALRHSDFRVNVFFATEAEKSYDMTGIVRSFGSWHAPDLDRIDTADLDNALSYLVNQQGHSVSELYPSILSEDAPEPDSPFIASVVEDITENTGSEAMSELCALVSIDGRGMMEFMDRLSNPTDSIVLPKDYATIGVFNEWGGCGGTMDIQLEKDAVLPLSMVRGFQLEGQNGSYGNYTVDETYGLVSSCWMPCSFSEGTPPDPREDYAAAIDKVREDSGHREPKAPERQQTPPRLGEISNECRDSSATLGVDSNPHTEKDMADR